MNLKNSFKKLGYYVAEERLQDIFDKIDDTEEKDQKITVNEYNIWKQRIDRSLKINKNNNLNNDKKWFVYYYTNDDKNGNKDKEDKEDKEDNEDKDQQQKHYYYFDYSSSQNKEWKLITTLNCNLDEETTKWAIYVPKMTSNALRKFHRSHGKNNVPKGHWEILNYEKEENEEEEVDSNINDIKEEEEDPEDTVQTNKTEEKEEEEEEEEEKLLKDKEKKIRRK